MIEQASTTDNRSEDIAIIGMSGRFPGAGNIDAFWENLRNGVESVRFFTDRELEGSGVDPANLRKANYIKAGTLLEDADLFDADFFDMTAREAACLDPQHRILLECAWETLEHAGYSPHSYTGAIGVYAGSRISEYLMCNLPIPDMAGLHAESGPLVANWKRILDNDKDTLTTRIAYKLDLRGQAVTVQTACSTSLVAIHMACQSLMRNECDMILAGGVCVRIPQKAGYLYSDGMIFSPDGHTRAFDAKGKGTIFSSGAGMVALKLLKRALADGDCIHALIKGSAVNNDGNVQKPAFTAPAVNGQSEVIARALSNANVDPGSVSYVETHGTATANGDLCEFTSLKKAFRSDIDRKGYCALGSVKTNIGHPTQAAGVIGLIKTVLMLKHKMLVPHLNFEEPNRQIDFLNSPFYVNTKLKKWASGNAPRLAGVNSFGVGGTNAHVILEEWPAVESRNVQIDRSTHILCLSAKSKAALKNLVAEYRKFLMTSPKILIEDLCFTANAGRAHFSHRVAVIADSISALQDKLAAISNENEFENSFRGRSVHTNRPKISFLFSGQGSQYIDMGRHLFNTQPCFQKNMKKCDKLLRPHLEKSLLSVLYPGVRESGISRPTSETGQLSADLDETIYTQTSLFALEYSLYELWRSWGVEPDFVMGHSLGEYAAACVAGVFSLEDALELVALRGRLMQEAPRAGAMAAVFSNGAQVEKCIRGYSDNVSMAAFNSPGNVVISGDNEVVQAIRENLERQGAESRLLNISRACHSPLMDPILEAFEQTAANVTYNEPKIKIISNLTGRLIQGHEMSRASYWRRHMREPVMFGRSIENLNEHGCNAFVELGPGSTLLAMGRCCIKNDDGVWLASLKKEQEDWPQMLSCLGALYTKGAAVDWTGFDQDYRRRRISLPTYPFQRKRYWIERNINKKTPEARNGARRIHSSISAHPLLGRRLPSALEEIQFESLLHAGSTDFIKDHFIKDNSDNEAVIFPATAYIEMILAAGSEIHRDGGQFIIEDLVIREALILPQDDRVITQLILSPGDYSGYSFQIFSLPADKMETNASWTLHAEGKIRIESVDVSLPQTSFESMREKCREKLPVDSFYTENRQRGIFYGPAFQAVHELWRGDGAAIARIRLPDALLKDADMYRSHPVLLDACLQIAKVAFPGSRTQATHNDFYIPMIFEKIHISSRLESPFRVYMTSRSGNDDTREIQTVDFQIVDSQGHVAAKVQGLHFKRATHASLLKKSKEAYVNDWLYEVKWRRQPLAASKPVMQDRQGIWLVLIDRGDVGAKLVEQLRGLGDIMLRVLLCCRISFLFNSI